MPHQLEDIINFQLNIPSKPEGVPGEGFMTKPMEREITYENFKTYLDQKYPSIVISIIT